MVRAEHDDLARLRLLHLDDHLSGFKHVNGAPYNPRTCRDIITVAEINALACTRLNDALMSGSTKIGDRWRGQPDAIFVVLYFLGNADFHNLISDSACVIILRCLIIKAQND